MDAEAIRELFAAFGPVSVRRMFGGAGVFADGIIIAIVADGVIYLKADEATVPAFEAEGLAPFTYQAKGGTRARDVVLAHARPALRRSRRARRLGA